MLLHLISAAQHATLSMKYNFTISRDCLALLINTQSKYQCPKPSAVKYNFRTIPIPIPTHNSVTWTKPINMSLNTTS